jgi:hypothetical protein
VPLARFSVQHSQFGFISKKPIERSQSIVSGASGDHGMTMEGRMSSFEQLADLRRAPHDVR